MWKFCLLWICAIFVSDEIGKAEKRKTPISGCLKQLVQSTFRGATHRMIISYYSVWEVARMATYLRLDIVEWSLKIMTVARCSKTLLLKFGFNVASTEKWQRIILTRSGSRVYEMGRVRASELGVKRGGWVICEMRNAKVRMGNLQNRLRKTLWLVGRNRPVSQITKHGNQSINDHASAQKQRRKAANN